MQENKIETGQPLEAFGAEFFCSFIRLFRMRFSRQNLPFSIIVKNIPLSNRKYRFSFVAFKGNHPHDVLDANASNSLFPNPARFSCTQGELRFSYGGKVP